MHNSKKSESISAVRSQFEKREMLNESLHDYLMRMFRYYLIVGGMPEAVKQFVLDQNIAKVRAIQKDISVHPEETTLSMMMGQFHVKMVSNELNVPSNVPVMSQ